MKKLIRFSVTFLFVISVVLCLSGIKAVQADASYSAGAQVTGSFSAVAGYDIATVRYVYTQNGTETYGFADISGSSSAGAAALSLFPQAARLKTIINASSNIIVFLRFFMAYARRLL